ncbi:MAG TPA: glycosyltransferase family 4 protein [Parafilimonas sp.]|nr:glycosyltransferase family 4 protein [Parafilimonas sp.]
MKILIYSDCFIFGGSEKVIENLLKSDALTNKFDLQFYYAYNKRYKKSIDKKFPNFTNIHSVAIASAFSKWGYESQLTNNKSPLQQLYLKLRYVCSLVFEKTSINNIYNYTQLLTLFKKERPDILYINNGGYPGAQSCRIAALAASKAGISNVVFNVNNLASAQKNKFDIWLDRKVNTAVKVFVTASKAAKEKLIIERKFDACKCVDIPNTLLKEEEVNSKLINGCLRNEFNVKHHEVVIGSAGLLTHRKGFNVLIDAIQLLKEINCQFKVFIFGEGEQRPFLQKMIAYYKLQQVIFLPGFRNNMQKYIIDFDVLVCPSIANEDFPYIILEAMLLRKPIIGTNIAGIPEQVLNNHNGYIIKPGSAQALAEALKKFLFDKEKLKTMGLNSYNRYSNNFSNELIIYQYNQLFNSLN